jgi:hypothetical protein
VSNEDDVPLGEEARRYYEQQFGERIRQVRKGGSQPNGRSGGTSRAGCGMVIFVFIAIRLLFAITRCTPDSSSYRYTPPPAPPVRQELPWERNDMQPLPKQPNPFGGEEDNFKK